MKRRALIFLTVFNVVLFLLSLMAYFDTKENLKIFNSSESDFNYTETEKGKVELILNQGKRVTIEFDETSAKVSDLYKYDDRPEMVSIIRFLRYYCEINRFILKRDNSELWGEMRLHTTLYKMGYKTAQTGDAEIEFYKDARWYVNVVSKVIGRMGI
ncbi:MAG: hypothetical protein IJ706_04780 [Clostridia bacterium]|nr:hypothetical protein [Clostridia bacterium]